MPHAAACRYAGISLATWERERQRIPEFGVEADRVEASGLVAAWRFLQMAAASEWRASLEYVKLYGATRGRDAARPDEPDADDQDADVTPDDVAAVVRILRAHELGQDRAADGRRSRAPPAKRRSTPTVGCSLASCSSRGRLQQTHGNSPARLSQTI